MSFKVLIVDDDINFRFALREMIPWEANGFEVAAEAVHGKQALQILEKQRMDLVVTDMDMPIMNGVQLTGEIKNRYPDIPILACSAFDDFRFVKEAMRLGAEDYILKQDLDGEQIIAIAKKLMEKQQKERMENLKKGQAQDRFLAFLKGERSELPDEVAASSYIRACPRMTVMTVHTGGGGTSLYDRSDFKFLFLLKMDEHTWMILLPLPEGQSAAQEASWLSQTSASVLGGFEDGMQIGMCEESGDYKKIPEMFRKASETLDRGIYFPRERTLRYLNLREKITGQNSPPEYDPQTKEPGEIVSDLQKMLTKYMPDTRQVNRLLASVYRTRTNHRSNADEEMAFEKSIEAAYYLEDKLSVLEAALQKETGKYPGSHPEIREALRYIEKHYAEDISLGDISSKVGLSDNYFSNLFKQETGENLTSYINRVRIEKAKQLLMQPGKKVYEVAEEVGFRNTTYFSTTFRKVTGMTVSEFKSRM